MAEGRRIETTAVDRPQTRVSAATNREFIKRWLRQLIGYFLRKPSERTARAVIRMLDLVCRSPLTSDGDPGREDFQRLLDHWRQLAAAVSRNV